MAELTAREVADLWIAAGGPRNRAVEWTAIALGESSYDTEAVSSAGAIGLWQIMPFNAAPNGTTVRGLYDPLTNARVAVRMSGHGSNCAAWDSCYVDIQGSGRYTFLGWPERGSADWNNLAVVSVQLGHDKLGAAVPPLPHGQANPIDAAEAGVQARLQGMLRVLVPQLIWIREVSQRQGLPGTLP